MKTFKLIAMLMAAFVMTAWADPCGEIAAPTLAGDGKYGYTGESRNPIEATGDYTIAITDASSDPSDGEDVGTYKTTVTLKDKWVETTNEDGCKWKDATVGEETDDLEFEWEIIVKEGGAEIASFTAAANLTTTATSVSASITVSPAPDLATATGQTVEYAISTAPTAPTTGWQDGRYFTGLTTNTTYYIFARSKESTTHNAGIAKSASIITPKKTGAGIVSFIWTEEIITYSASTTSVTINTAPDLATATGQTVEYAISTASTAPTTGWQDGKTFTGFIITYGTVYYIFARSKESTTHRAGTAKSFGVVWRYYGAEIASFTAAANLTVAATSITVSTVPTLATATGQTVEYARNTTATVPTEGWQTSTAFTGLTAGTTYYVFARSKEDATHRAGTAKSVSIIMPKRTGAEIASFTAEANLTATANSITVSTAPTLATATGQAVEYARNATNTVPTTGWQDGTAFTGLTASTTYYVFARAKESTTHNAGTEVYVQVTTLSKQTGAEIASFTAEANLTATANSITVSTVPTLATATGQAVEYARNSSATVPTTGWKTSTAFTGLTAGTTYYVFARAKESTTHNAGAAKSASITPKQTGAEIASFTAEANLTATANSITVSTAPTLATATGQTVEYARNATNTAPTTGWQDGTAFTGLTANTTYYVFARAKESTAYNAGAAKSVEIKTLSGSGSGGCIESCSGYKPPTTPVLSKVETGNRALHIAGGLSLSVSSSATVSIYSLKGNLVQSQSYASGEHTMSLNNLPKGMYIVKVSFRNRENTLSHSETIKITVK